MKVEEIRQELEEAKSIDDLSPEVEQQVRQLAGIAKAWFNLKKFIGNNDYISGQAIDLSTKKIKHQKTPLQQMLEKQYELDERIREERRLDRYWLSSQHELSDLCTAMSNEIEELRDCSSWKWWSNMEEMDVESAREELIDIFHFWLSVANLLDMDAEDIFDEYMEKNEVNHSRQDGDY